MLVIAGFARQSPLGSVASLSGSIPRMTKESKADYRFLGRRHDAENAACAGHDNLSRSLE
jgi:hypothetical protein